MYRVLIAVMLAVVVAFPVSAEETGALQPRGDRRPVLLFPTKEEMLERKNGEDSAREWAKEQYKNALSPLPGNTMAPEDVRENMLERRAEFASSTEARREMLKEKLMERREHFASSTALRKAMLDENVKERVMNRVENAGRLLQAMLERLGGLSDRIQARIDTLEAAGVDASAAQAELDEAQDAIEAAADAVAEVKTAFDEAFASETPRENMGAVKTAAEEAKAAIRAAHKALMEAVQALPHREPAEEATNEE